MTPAAPGWRATALRLAVGGNVDADKQQRAVRGLLAAGRACGPAQVVAALRRHGACGDAEAKRALQRLDALGGDFVLAGDEGYPAPLRGVWPELGAPLWLFVVGDVSCLVAAPAVAIVGTRRPTLDGLRTTRTLAATLAEAGVVIVSGFARGIDQAAHRAALDAGGETIAVLGTGLGVDYPARSGGLRARIADHGALLSELAPGVGPRPWQFPARNRIVSGLTLATVVVEGGPTSGALQTARLAAEQGRDVWAVPGSVNAPASQAPLALLRDGAALLTGPDDLLASLASAWRHQLALPGSPAPSGSPVPWHHEEPASRHGERASRERAGGSASRERAGGGGGASGASADGDAHGLSEPAQAVLRLLGAVPASVDELVTASRLPAHVAMAAIGELVAAGRGEATVHGVVRS